MNTIVNQLGWEIKVILSLEFILGDELQDLAPLDSSDNGLALIVSNVDSVTLHFDNQNCHNVSH